MNHKKGSHQWLPFLLDICILMVTKFSNKLIAESSPYLLQHAHNPVDWYPWGEEALQKAKEENKPILVSIGYSACHWCHVMEKESFENEETAAIMNQHFINIKIDREERPDLDQIYMDAVQAISGSGGWPLNVFLTPDKKPFYGGTYFPPVRAYNRSSWREVLHNINKLWKEKQDEVEEQAENLTAHLHKSNLIGNLINKDQEVIFTNTHCTTIFESILKNADTILGGFGKAPKFPQTFTIQYLLQYYSFTREEKALQQALLSIDKMLFGGIYDQAGGGLARYSTDNDWLVPHFEKMLYDNALFITVLCEAFQITKEKRYEKAIRQIITFLQKEMQDKDAGFYAALDADSEGIEGKFYVWQRSEIEKILGGDAFLFCDYFDVSEQGNWEGNNILQIKEPLDDFALARKLDVLQLESILNNCLDKLLLERNKRIRPGLDDKILLGWNALLITALCKASAALDSAEYRKLAEDNYNLLIRNFSGKAGETAMFHTYKNGIARYPAFLDDYAYLIQACIQLQEITSDQNYLQKARELTGFVLDKFMDEENSFFYYTIKDQQDIIVRKKEVYDGAQPSGNSIMAENLFYLAVVFDIKQWFDQATKATQTLLSAVMKYPTSFGIWASVIAKQANGINEIVITGPEMVNYRRELLKEYLPNKILQCSITPNDKFSMLKGKNIAGKSLIYLCKNYTCLAPFQGPEDFLKEIQKGKPRG